MSDYLAIIRIGGGSSWGRASNKEKAITTALKALRDWQSLFEVSDIEVVVNVVDVEGYDVVQWHVDGFHGKKPGADTFEKFNPPLEYTNRRTPRFKRRSA
jgi:hypothetical protein